jgi:hypothetical protein
MNEDSLKEAELLLEDPWFAADERPSDPPPESVDPTLDEWFARGRPLSSRPPPSDS